MQLFDIAGNFSQQSAVTGMSIFKEPVPGRFSSYANRIRDLREDRDLTQAQVAEFLHVGQRTYSDYEHGKIRIPVDSLILLAQYYDTDMNYICGLTKKKLPFPKEE